MTDSTTSCRDFYQYATPEPTDKLDGYWLFATPLDGEIELFQVGTMVVGDQVRHTVAAVVTPDGVRYERRGSDTCVRDGDRFRIQVGPLLTVTSDDGRSFRIQTPRQQNGVAADLEVRPRTPHEWDMGGAFYGTALESDIEGTISIDDVAHRISTTGAFEHAASWRSTNDTGGWAAHPAVLAVRVHPVGRRRRAGVRHDPLALPRRG